MFYEDINDQIKLKKCCSELVAYLNSVQFNANYVAFIDCFAVFGANTLASMPQFTIVECPAFFCVTERLLRKLIKL